MNYKSNNFVSFALNTQYFVYFYFWKKKTSMIYHWFRSLGQHFHSITMHFTMDCWFILFVDKPVPVTVNVCGDPVANELICELLHNEICICNDPSVRSLCGNFCADRCATKVSSLPACKPLSSISVRSYLQT
jgi:hypothetical protein